MRHLDLALLRTFVAVAETTSATRAADRVHLTQAAVSQQIKRLEDGLGRPLFDRDQRRFRLTPTGERLVVQARRLLNLNDEILGGLADPDADGEVMLGVRTICSGRCCRRCCDATARPCPPTVGP